MPGEVVITGAGITHRLVLGPWPGPEMPHSRRHRNQGFDGMRHLPLIDNTAMRTSHGAAVSDDMFNENRRNMGKYAVRPSECIHVMDIATWLISQTLSNLRTLDKFGPNATILNGQLGSFEGIPVLISEKMLKTASDGLVTDGVAGTVGGLLTFNRSQWHTGTRRNLMLEATRSAEKRQNILTVSARLAFMERTNARGSATHTALIYNITGI